MENKYFTGDVSLTSDIISTEPEDLSHGLQEDVDFEVRLNVGKYSVLLTDDQIRKLKLERQLWEDLFASRRQNKDENNEK